MPYEDDAFLRMSPAGIIARVAANDPSLAIVSALSIQEQIRIGWIGNPAVEHLYELTSAGVWIARTDASGYSTDVSALNSNVTNERQILGATTPGVSQPTTGQNDLVYKQPRIAYVAYTIQAGGGAPAQTFHTGPTGYYPVVRLKRIISDTTDATVTLTFSCATGTLVGLPAYTVALTASTVNTQLLDVLLYNLTDASAIACTPSNGTENQIIWIEYEYWSET